MDKYYIMSNTEDGAGIDGPLSKKELCERLDENYWGDPIFCSSIPENTES